MNSQVRSNSKVKKYIEIPWRGLNKKASCELKKGAKTLAKAKSVFVCNNCGYESGKWLGKCPACNEWNSFFEQKLETKEIENKRQNKQIQEPISLKDITSKEINRLSTGFLELDRVLRRRIGRWFISPSWWRTRNSESLH